MKRVLTCLKICCLVALSWCGASAVADPVPEYEMKAAYLYNFMRLTSWPSTTEEHIRLCLFGEDHFGGKLEKLTANKVNGKDVRLIYLAQPHEAQNCQLVFIDGTALKNAPDLLAQLANYPVLTVTDHPTIFQQGVMIGVSQDNQRLVFDINYEAVHKSGVILSSKLLRIARKVIQ